MESAGLGFLCFICLFLFIFIYFHWFLLISLISSISTYFLCFCYFFRVCREMIAPSLPKQVGFKNPNRTRKLENRIVSFVFKGSSESIFPFQWSNFLRFCDEKITFFGFRRFLQFLEAPSRHFPEFRWFWGPAKGF